MVQKTSAPRLATICLALTVLTLATFWPVLQCEFVNYDDPYYVTQNAHVQNGIDWNSLQWAFTSRYVSNWHPLTWVSHMADCELFGLEPGAHHMINLLLHLANTVIFFLAL